MRFPTSEQWFRQTAADAAKRAMDANGGWDAINRRIPLPQTLFGKLLVFLGLSYAGATADQNLSDNTLIGKVIKEVIADAASELGSPRRNVSGTPPEIRNVVPPVIVVPRPSLNPGPPLSERAAGTLDEISAWLDKKAR